MHQSNPIQSNHHYKTINPPTTKPISAITLFKLAFSCTAPPANGAGDEDELPLETGVEPELDDDGAEEGAAAAAEEEGPAVTVVRVPGGFVRFWVVLVDET